MQGGATGTGTFTLLAPSTSTNRTLTLPDATGTVQVSGSPISGTTASFSGNVTLGSSVLATPTGSAPAYLCRAWVNFNGTNTVAIRASGNVSSITDNGTGDYTVNFTTAMPDANYNFVTNSSNTTSANILCISQLNWDNPTKSTSALRLYNLKSNTGALTDQDTISVSIFR